MSITNIKAFSLSENTGESTDTIRDTIQSFWEYDGSELVYDTRNLYNATTEKANTGILLFNLGFSQFSSDSPVELDTGSSIDIKEYTQKVEITPVYLSDGAIAESLAGRTSSGRVQADPERNFDSYIEDQIIPSLGIPRNEYKLDLKSPIEYASDVDNNSSIAGTVNFVYNYGLERYENRIEDSTVVESSLENFYKVFPALSGERLTKKRVTNRLNRTGDSFALAKPPIQDFFMNSAGFIESLDRQIAKDSFPFYNEVYFTNPPDQLEEDKFRQSLKDTGLLMAFCDFMNREDFKVSQLQSSSVIDTANFINSYLSSSYENDMQSAFKEVPALKAQSVNLYDISSMLKIMYDAMPANRSSLSSVGETTGREQVGTRTLRDKAFLTDGEEAEYRLDTISEFKEPSNTTENYETALDHLVSTINELISNENNFKNYKDILEGKKKTYQSNVLFYRIKKFEQGSDNPIQNFWIPAENGYRGIRYIDTQVKYGKIYRYEVNAFKFIIGSEYRFSEQPAKVFDFRENLEQYVTEIQKPLENMIGLGIIRGTYKAMYAEYPDALPGFSSDFKERIVDQQTTIALAEAVDQNQFFSREMVKVNSGSEIDLVAQNVLSGGNFPDTDINLSMLTEEEVQSLRDIRSSWECLSNTNGTGFGTLAKIETTVRNVRVLGQIQEIIVQELTDEKKRNAKLKAWVIGLIITAALVTAAILTFGSAIPGALATLSAASTAPSSAGIAGGLFGIAVAQKAAAATATLISSIGAIVATGASGMAVTAIKASAESKKSNQTGLTVDKLELNDIERIYQKINALTAIPLPFLNSSSENQLIKSSGVYFIDFPNDPQTFDLDNVDVPRLNTGLVEFDDSFEPTSATTGVVSSVKKRKEYLQQKQEELKQVEALLTEETQKLESLVATFNGCYVDFIEAAGSIGIVADYKRINKYTLNVQLKPSLKFAEMPYYQAEGMILDNPPIYPNVNVITYRGVADRLSFFMNSGQGEIENQAVSFSDEEDTFISNYRKSRKLNDFQPLLYKSDEKENLGTVFEIRRLSTPPDNYQSFREARTVTASDTANIGTLPAATYDDRLNSNTKYYYIFRVADRRGTVSYPSGVMEIEIVENSGIIYPVIKPYEFKNPKTDTTKNLKRLLNIVPRITQVVPPIDTPSYDGLAVGPTSILGREEEGLFGKQFKLRLTSKQTGKVVDLNLNFKATVIESAEAE